jgi:uncharacterized protein (DUF433 family)
MKQTSTLILIESDEERIGGKPALHHSRISVEIILEMINYGQSIDDILECYPHLDRKLVDGVVEVGLIARKCLNDVDPETTSMRLFGRRLHLDSNVELPEGGDVIEYHDLRDA